MDNNKETENKIKQSNIEFEYILLTPRPSSPPIKITQLFGDEDIVVVRPTVLPRHTYTVETICVNKKEEKDFVDIKLKDNGKRGPKEK